MQPFPGTWYVCEQRSDSVSESELWLTQWHRVWLTELCDTDSSIPGTATYDT